MERVETRSGGTAVGRGGGGKVSMRVVRWERRAWTGRVGHMVER